MLKSKIKPGMTVAVFVDRLNGPADYKTGSGAKTQLHSQPARMGLRGDVYDSQVKKATVVQVDAPLYTSNRGYSLNYSAGSGVLVAFAEPVKHGYGANAETHLTAIVPSKHILRTWAEEETMNANRDAARVAAAQRRRDAAESFAPQVAKLRADLEAVGIPTEVHGDLSGFYGNGVSFGTNHSEVDGRQVMTGFNDLSVRVDRRLLEQLIAIAARHGEVVE